MRRQIFACLIFLFSGLCFADTKGSDGLAEHPEVERVQGFAEHLEQRKARLNAQDQGLQIYLESLEIQAREYEKARREYQAQKKLQINPELSPDYQEHVFERQAARNEKELMELSFRNERLKEAKILNQIQIDKMAELGLPENRPRFDFEKRSLYGGKPQFSRSRDPFPNTPSVPNFGSGSSPFPPAQEPFPPQAPFDDFPPPPAFPEDNFDLPPPPPMDPLGGEPPTGSDDFFPPPPPPAFDDNFQF